MTFDPGSIPGDELSSAPDLSDAAQAEGFARDRYTAARRHYTHLYVESESTEDPGEDALQALEDARRRTVELAGCLREVEDGDPEAIRRELEAGPVSADERALTTNRFTIADLRRAAAEPPATWNWKIGP